MSPLTKLRSAGKNSSLAKLAKSAAFFLAIIVVCGGLAGVLTGAMSVPLLSSLPPIAVVAVVVLAAVTPILLVRWQVTFWGFIAWLMVEDLIRKYAGNSIGVYAVKQIIFVLLVIGLVMDPGVRGSWRKATGSVRVALYCLIGWAIVMSVPSLFVDLRLPFLGLGANFAYIPLVVAGFVLAREKSSLRTLLLGVSLITAAAVLVGVVQAVIGPAFLDPGKATPGLENLVTVRQSATVAGVFRPTGTFVDPGRFASLAFISLAVSLCAGMVVRGKQKLLPYGCAGLAMTGVWLSGGRAPLIVGAVVVIVAAVVPRVEGGRRSFLVAGSVGVVVLLAFVILLANNPGAFTSRLSFYQDTLDPSQRGNEWSRRWTNYSNGIFRGIEQGGLIGQGTGAESVGKQYFFSGSGGRSTVGQYQVESGYGSLTVEWGIIGLVLWVIWVVRWLARALMSTRMTRAGPRRSVGGILVAYLFLFLVVQFYAGIAIFQNYIGNAFFWLLSGVVFALPWADPLHETDEAIEFDEPRVLAEAY